MTLTKTLEAWPLKYNMFRLDDTKLMIRTSKGSTFNVEPVSVHLTPSCPKEKRLQGDLIAVVQQQTAQWLPGALREAQ